MGITTPLDAVVSMPLGTKEVLPIDMAGAVASIAADGMWNQPYYIDRVEGPDGQVLLEHEADPRRAASVQSARLACEVLEKNVQSGTGTRARIPDQHAAGKTGTAQNASDGWFVGFTPYLATAVWIGSPTDNDAVRDLRHRASPAARTRRRSGAGTCAPGTRVARRPSASEPRAAEPQLALPVAGPRQRLRRRRAAPAVHRRRRTRPVDGAVHDPARPARPRRPPSTDAAAGPRPPPSTGGGGGTGGDHDGGNG